MQDQLRSAALTTILNAVVSAQGGCAGDVRTTPREGSSVCPATPPTAWVQLKPLALYRAQQQAVARLHGGRGAPRTHAKAGGPADASLPAQGAPKSREPKQGSTTQCPTPRPPGDRAKGGATAYVAGPCKPSPARGRVREGATPPCVCHLQLEPCPTNLGSRNSACACAAPRPMPVALHRPLWARLAEPHSSCFHAPRPQRPCRCRTARSQGGSAGSPRAYRVSPPHTFTAPAPQPAPQRGRGGVPGGGGVRAAQVHTDGQRACVAGPRRGVPPSRPLLRPPDTAHTARASCPTSSSTAPPAPARPAPRWRWPASCTARSW